MECVFCKIATKELPADIFAEHENAVAFRDIHPKAPVHILVIPKIHCVSLAALEDDHRSLIGDLMLFVARVAEQAGLKEGGYKVVTNVGRGAGQAVDHLHFHILGGWSKNPKTLDV